MFWIFLVCWQIILFSVREPYCIVYSVYCVLYIIYCVVNSILPCSACRYNMKDFEASGGCRWKEGLSCFVIFLDVLVTSCNANIAQTHIFSSAEWHQQSNINRLISTEWHYQSDINRVTLKKWHQLIDVNIVHNFYQTYISR